VNIRVAFFYEAKKCLTSLTLAALAENFEFLGGFL
jgi:hypothetical protein